MDSNKKYTEFIKISFFLILVLSIIFILLLGTIIFRQIMAYNTIIIILSVLVMLYVLFNISFLVIVNRVYKYGKINKTAARIFHRLLRILAPILLQISNILNIDKDLLRGFFIELNNLMTKSFNIKCKSNKILLLVPHCLQNSDCEYKVAGNSENCKRCGKCNIADVLKLTDKYNLNLAIATGGTIARNAVKKFKPELIISVACNRDLLSGIIDVGNIPVIGVENERPYGPCHDTKVNMDILEQNIINCITNEE